MGLPKGRTNNPNGREKGSKNLRTLQFEALGESIIGEHSERFNEILRSFMNSEDVNLQIKGCQMYMDTLEFFKPKQSRVQHSSDQNEPFQIIIAENI